MSRIGKQPIKIPSGVTITVDPDFVTVQGSKGTLKQFTMPGVTVSVDGDQALVTRDNDEAVNRAKHGLMRSLVNNMVVGVSQGFTKQLEINGVGYRVASQGADLKFNLGCYGNDRAEQNYRFWYRQTTSRSSSGRDSRTQEARTLQR
jgi:large subunit ribosomal protein L6